MDDRHLIPITDVPLAELPQGEVRPDWLLPLAEARRKYHLVLHGAAKVDGKWKAFVTFQGENVYHGEMVIKRSPDGRLFIPLYIGGKPGRRIYKHVYLD